MLSPTFKKQSKFPWVDLSSKLVNNSKLTGDEHKKHLKNNLCLYYSTEDHKLDFCPKKQTMVTLKGCGASAAVDLSYSCFQKILRKMKSDLQDSAQIESHVKLLCIVTSPIQLNISALSDTHSLCLFYFSLNLWSGSS